jgi:dipeptidase E
MINLHLFSSPGNRDMRWVLDACRPYLKDKDDPSVAFLPMASLRVDQWLEYTVREFKGLAQVDLIDTERMDLPTMESIIRRARVVYISGGNTFLLNHRLHISGLMPFLRKKVQAGLPVVGFSAGAIVCGPNILTSKDMNSVQTDRFDALNISPFNFLAHYDADAYGQSILHDDWLADYHVFHDNPVIMLSDGAYVKMAGKQTTLVRGDAWILRKGAEKEKLVTNVAIVP